MPSHLRWGIIGPGSIAREFAADLRASKNGRLVAIATRNPATPGLAEAFPGAKIHDGYAAMLRDPEVDAVYIATPNDSHREWAIKAAEAGKHVLVEKPIALSATQAEAMFEAAAIAKTFMGEAFMYRHHPMTARIGQLVSSGVIGDVRLIQSSFGIQMEEFKPGHRLYDRALGGGGILDVGCYVVSMARFVAGAAQGKSFLDPVSVSAVTHFGQSGVDEWAAATLGFPGGIIAQLSCAVSVALDNVLRIHGSTGWLEVREFWSAGGNRYGGSGRIDIVREEGPRETLSTLGPLNLYAYEADAVSEAVAAGRQEFIAPGMSWADSLGNIRVLDQWRGATPR